MNVRRMNPLHRWLVPIAAAMVPLLCALSVSAVERVPAAFPACSVANGLPQPSERSAAEEVGIISITVTDLAVSTKFFVDVLSFRLESEQELAGAGFERLVGLKGARARSARLRLGNERIELLQFAHETGRPIPPDSRSNDRWFQHIAIVVSDLQRAVGVLTQHGVRFVSEGAQTLPSWNPAAGGIQACYFNDPDGHILEVIAFPLGKGSRQWHTPRSDLFLGIDHTAIVVSDTAEALRLYRDLLGLRVAGTSENYGVEQERLNSVFGAHLRITTLRAERGPGIELLEYLSPTNGRDAVRDARCSDLSHWHVAVHARQAVASNAARAAGARWVSAGPLSPDEGVTPSLVRDRDGHALLIDVRHSHDAIGNP